MPNASYVQSNFQAGEWSAAAQARLDDQEYKKALSLCLNYIPNQEGSLTSRSGFKRCGNTRDNAPARLLPFRFTAFAPYVSEFTANNLRFWANGQPIFANEVAGIVDVSGTPPVFTIGDVLGNPGVPSTWATGDRVMLIFDDISNLVAGPALANREFIITIVDAVAGTITLTDAETGVPLSAAVGPFGLGVGAVAFFRIVDLVTPYLYPEGVRQVQYTTQTLTNVDGTGGFRLTPPEHRVTYLYPLASPRSLGSSTGVEFGLIKEKFIDGPYLDSTGTDLPMTVSATTGEITLTLHGYDGRIVYMKGDLVVSYATTDPYYYVSLQDNNKGHLLLETSPWVNAFWLMVRVNENVFALADTYETGFHTVAAPFDTNGVGTVYYSKIDANTNHQPASSPTQWSTAPPTWDALISYSVGAFVVQAGVRYLAHGVPTLGLDPFSDPTNWSVAPDMDAAVDTFTNKTTGWLSSPLFYEDDAGGDGFGLLNGNPGRLIRLKWSPQPWTNKITYATDDQVNYKDVLYKSLTNSNLNNIPETDTTNWKILPTTIKWTWAEITDASTHMFQATVQLRGEDLPDDLPVWEFRFGAYGDSVGWPTAGAYQDGRLALSGVVPNRIDLGCSNQGFNFAPTAPDGTVADSNAISLTMNCEEAEEVRAMAPTTEGLIILTSEAEWLLSASALNDPLTPTSAQVRRTTAWSAFPNETTRLPSALAAIQNGGRRVLEYRTFVDMTSYQSRLNVLDLARHCQHLTAGGIGVTQYQSLSQPVLWCCPSDYLIADFTNSLTHHTCPLPIIPPIVQPGVQTNLTSCTLFGIGYARSPELNYTAPFSFEHGRTLDGDTQTVSIIAVQRGILSTSDYLYAVVTGSDAKAHVEMLMPNFESTPLYDTFNMDGTVDRYGTLSQAYMLDSGVTPAGCVIAADGLSADFYGLFPLAGQTVSFTIRGKYVGEVVIDADGHVNVPFTTGTDETFVISDIGRAMCASINSNLLPDTSVVFGPHGQPFVLDPNGNSGVLSPGDETVSANFFGQFGYKYRRRGQMLRPIVGSANGPTFGKIVQNARAGIFVDACYQIKAGGTFDELVDIPLTVDGVKDTTALTPGVHATGIYRDFIQDDNTFDGRICWEQTVPVPGNILSVGGFLAVEDV